MDQSQKKLKTKFSNKFKKPCFWSILGLFSQFLGQKHFSWKIRLCHAQLHMGFQNHAKIQKKLMTQFKENARTDGRTEGQTYRPFFIGPFQLSLRAQKKRHKKIVILAKCKLNSIDSKISESLLNNEISHEDFTAIVKKQKKIS